MKNATSAKTVKVYSKARGVIMIPRKEYTGFVAIEPGITDVPAAEWTEVKGHPVVEQFNLDSWAA